MTLEELRAKRTEILQNLGVAKVSFGDRSVEFRDIEKALDIVDREIAALSPSTTTSRSTTYAVFRKGS